MERTQRSCPESLRIDDALYQRLFSYLSYGEDLDDLLFYGECCADSER